MAYVYDPETGEITEDGTDDIAPSPEYDETPIEIPEPEAPEPVEPDPEEPDPTISEEDRRFEEDWDDVVAGRLTIDDVAAKYPTQIWDRVAAGSADVRDWALNQIKAAGTAAVKSVTKPDGSIDWSKVAGIGVGLATYTTGSKGSGIASGYQGTIPKLTGERAAVPGTYDPNRAAGSSGQRYFSDVVYGDTDSVEARAAKAREQAAGLAALNASNSARRAPLTYNLRKPIDTDNIGAARPATPVGTQGSGGSGAPAGMKPGFVIGGAGGGFDSAGAIASISAQIQQELAGIKTDADLNRYLANTQYTPEQLGIASGYKAEDIAARMGDAWREGKQTTQEYLNSAYQPTSQQAPVAGAVVGGTSAAPVSDLMTQLNSFTSNDQLNDFFANTTASAAELAAQSGYNVADIQARMDAAQPTQSQVESYFFAKGGVIPRGLASLPQNTIYRAKGGPARYLRGETNGQADKIATNIDGKQPAALSHGEFVVPADVVSALGGGNSDAGAKTLYSMMDRVRHQAHGTKKQMRQVDPAKVLPS